MAKHNKKVLLVGGGTGGHAVPIFEVYKKLKEINSSIEIIVIGSGSAIEKNFFSIIPNYRIIRSGKLRRHLTVRNFYEFANFIIGIIQAYFLIKREKPGIVFSKGGYVSLPVVTVARLVKVPYFIHESDIEMGITNKNAARGASKVFVSFPLANYSKVDAKKYIYSGPIIRDEIKDHVSAKRADFNFDNSDPIILVTGGSQGALPINKALTKIVPKLLEKYNIIHQTGDHSFEWVNSFRLSLPLEQRKRYFATDFLKIEGGRDRMLEAIDLADLVVARAGANTMTELAAKGKAAILISWQHAAGDHQRKNAEFLEAKNAAIVVPDEKLQPQLLLDKIESCFSNGGKIAKELSQNIKLAFKQDGLDIIAKAIMAEVERQEKC